jgi:hypothetical protein
MVFIEVISYKSDPEEIVQIENNLENVWFELGNEEDDSYESIESKEEVEQTTMVVRMSERIIKLVERYSPLNFCSTFVLTTRDNEPKLVREAFDSAEGKLWKDSMVKEMESNETWDLVKLPSGRNHVNRKWVFNKKTNAAGQVEKFKSRLVEKGYS